MPRSRGPLFTELESLWYERLRKDGFQDIESTSSPDRPLKHWHSLVFKRASEQHKKQKQRSLEYYEKTDDFANHSDFKKVTEFMTKHGNSIFTSYGVTKIWDMHRSGKSDRQIAKEMECSKSCITFMLKRFRKWMELL